MKKWIFMALLGAAVVAPASRACADVATYTVDPARTSMTISGTYQDAAIIGQGFFDIGSGGPSPSFTTSFQGTITTNRDSAGGEIQITGGSVTAQDNGLWLPPLPTPGNFGFAALGGETDGFSQINGAIRFFSFSLSGPSLPQSSFDVSALSLSAESGQVDLLYIYNNNVIGDSSAFSVPFPSALTLGPGVGTVSGPADASTLTIPVQTSIDLVINGAPLEIQLAGTIVATAPEPGTLAALLSATPLLLLGNGRRKS